MPLIQVSYQHEYAPHNRDGFGGALLFFCQNLPAKLAAPYMSRWLDEGTTEADVQVTFHEFSWADINTTGVQFRMEFTEQLNDGARASLREELAYQVQNGLAQYITAPSIALDIYAGGWCGVLIKDGEIAKTW